MCKKLSSVNESIVNTLNIKTKFFVFILMILSIYAIPLSAEEINNDNKVECSTKCLEKLTYGEKHDENIYKAYSVGRSILRNCSKSLREDTILYCERRLEGYDEGNQFQGDLLFASCAVSMTKQACSNYKNAVSE